jgi:hypothetical protein
LRRGRICQRKCSGGKLLKKEQEKEKNVREKKRGKLKGKNFEWGKNTEK